MKKLLLAFGLLLFFPSAGMAEKVVTVATLTDYQPHTFDKDSAVKVSRERIPPGSDSARLQGFSWDVLRESFHEMGYTIELSVYPWKRAFNLVKSGKVDVLFPTGFNDERADFFHYSDKYINRADFLVYVNKDTKLQWDGLESLQGLNIGQMRGWNYGSLWDGTDSFEKMELDSILPGFEMLAKGRIDGLAGYEINFDYALKQAAKQDYWQEGEPPQFVKLPVFGASQEFAAGAKSNPNIVGILADFDTGLSKIEGNGTYDRILEKW